MPPDVAGPSAASLNCSLSPFHDEPKYAGARYWAIEIKWCLCGRSPSLAFLPVEMADLRPALALREWSFAHADCDRLEAASSRVWRSECQVSKVLNSFLYSTARLDEGWPLGTRAGAAESAEGHVSWQSAGNAHNTLDGNDLVAPSADKERKDRSSPERNQPSSSPDSWSAQTNKGGEATQIRRLPFDIVLIMAVDSFFFCLSSREQLSLRLPAVQTAGRPALGYGFKFCR